MVVNLSPVNQSMLSGELPGNSGSTRRNINTETTEQGTKRATLNQDTLLAENPLSQLSDNFDDSNRISDEAVTPSSESELQERNLVYDRVLLESARRRNESQTDNSGDARATPDLLTQNTQESEKGQLLDVIA